MPGWDVRYSDGGRTVIIRKVSRFRTLALALGGVLVLIVGFALYSRFAAADTLDFHPRSCLGTWQNVANALGDPDLVDGASTDQFTDQNSATFAGGADAQIFCGNFVGSDVSDKIFKRATLKLSLAWKPKTVGGTSGGAVFSGGDLASSSATTSDIGTTSTSNAVTSSDASAGASSSASGVDTQPAASSTSETSAQTAPAPQGTSSQPVPTPPATPVNSSASSFLRYFIPRAFAEVIPSSASDTLAVPFDPSNQPTSTSASSGGSRQLEVDFSLDGKEWSMVGVASPDNIGANYDLPVRSWDDIDNLQVSLKASADLADYTVYLDGMTVVAEYDTGSGSQVDLQVPAIQQPPVQGDPAASEPRPAPVFFDPHAKHTCKVDPFSTAVARGASAKFEAHLHPSDPSLAFNTQLGAFPAGITGSIMADTAASSTTSSRPYVLSVSAGNTAVPGSYNTVLIYKEAQASGTVATNFCQFNIVVK